MNDGRSCLRKVRPLPHRVNEVGLELLVPLTLDALAFKDAVEHVEQVEAVCLVVMNFHFLLLLMYVLSYPWVRGLAVLAKSRNQSKRFEYLRPYHEPVPGLVM